MAGRWGAGVLVYSVIASLDGYTADAEGKFDWAEPDEEVLGYLNDLERGIGTYLYGRRMYETMVGWETVPLDQMDSPGSRDFAGIWRSADRSSTPPRCGPRQARGRGSSPASTPKR